MVVSILRQSQQPQKIPPIALADSMAVSTSSTIASSATALRAVAEPVEATTYHKTPRGRFDVSTSSATASSTTALRVVAEPVEATVFVGFFLRLFRCFDKANNHRKYRQPH